MTTLIPTSQHQQATAASVAATPAAGVESYEDMFKEITRKLYGDESAHGLYPLNNAQVAQLAQTPSAPPEGERSFTTLVSDRSLAQLEYENVMPTEISNGNFKSEEHLSTAFGLAALMHNGFPPPTINFPITGANNVKQTTQPTGDDRQWNQQNHHQQNQPQQQQEEGGLTWNNNKNATTYTQKLFKVKTKQEPVAQEIIIHTSTTHTTNGGANIKSENTQIQKRYNCSVCPYSTDRRDLFTRHENIHKEEKPFHCYACLKQFNRADHVKKHFLRMHREMEYDINKTRRYPPSSKQVNNINSNNNSSNKNNNYFYNQQQSTEPQQLLVGTTINIPTFTQNQSNTANTQHNNTTTIIEHVVQNSGSTSGQSQVAASHQIATVNIKHEKSPQGGKTQKIKGEKRFMCCYCPWSGADNWGLKRHLNTHTKPFVCLLCDYKAARSERLTTHIFKVHNKKACNKCNFFADDQAQLAQHQLDSHQNEVRNVRTSNNQTTNNHPTTPALTVNNITVSQPVASVASNQSTSNVLRTLTNTFVPNIHHTPQTNHTFGQLQMQALSRNTASVAQDFRSAGGENFITNAIQQHFKGSITLTSVNRDASEQNGAIGIQQKKRPKAMSPIDSHSPPAFINRTGEQQPSDGSKRRRKLSPFNDKENVNDLLTKQLSFLKQQHSIFLKNLNESVMSDSERLKTVEEINEIFETMYNNSMTLISSMESDKRPKLQQAPQIKAEPQSPSKEGTQIKAEPQSPGKVGSKKYHLPDYLKNNGEITVIMEPDIQILLDQNESRKNRKQLKPKKIEKAFGVDSKASPRNFISDLRDKHMVRLVTLKKSASCYTCRNKSLDAASFFSNTSLLLHKFWRHSSNKFECHHCQMKFNEIYKLKLHKKLRKH